MRSCLLILLMIVSTGARAELSPEREKELENLVVQDCGSCHGLTLKGGLGPDIRSTALENYEPEDITTIILDGLPDTAMPPWRPLLNEAEAQWIADYLQSEKNQ